MKYILVVRSRTEFIQDTPPVLASTLKEPFDQIAVFGVDCATWEDVIDEILVGDGQNPDELPTTSSHPKENQKQVLDFANTIYPGEERKIQIIDI